MARNTQQDIVTYGSWQGIDDHDIADWHHPFTYQGKQYHAFNTGQGMDNKTERQWVISDDKPITANNYIAKRDSPGYLDFTAKNWRTWAEDMINLKAEREGEYFEGGGFLETAPDIDYNRFAQFLDPDGNVKDKGGLVQYLRTLPQFKDKGIAEIEAAIGDMPKMGIGQAALAGARGKAQADIYGLQEGLKGSRMQSMDEAGAAGVYSPVSTGFGGDTSTAYGQLAEAGTSGTDIYGLAGQEEEKFANWLANY